VGLAIPEYDQFRCVEAARPKQRAANQPLLATSHAVLNHDGRWPLTTRVEGPIKLAKVHGKGKSFLTQVEHTFDRLDVPYECPQRSDRTERNNGIRTQQRRERNVPRADAGGPRMSFRCTFWVLSLSWPMDGWRSACHPAAMAQSGHWLSHWRCRRWRRVRHPVAPVSHGSGLLFMAPPARSAKVRRATPLGRSVGGRLVVANELGDPASPRRVLVVGCIHGDESAGRRSRPCSGGWPHSGQRRPMGDSGTEPGWDGGSDARQRPRR
jgi:hypothetical protein